jgi:ABC-type transport system, involved in lipoprotein release, permease component
VVGLKKHFLLAGSNLRKAKSQTTAIIVLMLLASVMLNLWLMLSTDYKQNFDRCHDKLNAGHVTLSLSSDNEEIQKFLTETIEKDMRTDSFSLDPIMQMPGSFSYNGGEINAELVLLEKQTALTRSVEKIEIVEDSPVQSGIYLPVLYQSEDIATGKTITLSIGGNDMSYTVCGFFNSVMAGSHNCTLCGILLTEDKYRELEQSGFAVRSTLCSVRLKDKADSESYEAMLKNAVSTRYPAVRTVSNSYSLVSQSRYISQMICSGILSAMAFLILLIALIVMASNIINYIQVEMKNLGAFQAMGYTCRQLTGSLLLQFGSMSSIAVLAGTGISYLLFPSLNMMMSSQTGIPYKIHFLPLPLLMTFTILEGSVAAVVWLSARRIRKIEPITALRQGIMTHNFRHNHVPLEKTRCSLIPNLALKTALSGMKHNVIVSITMYVLSLIIVFSGLMTENVIADTTPFLNLIGGEIADSCINVNAKTEKVFLQTMAADDRVEKTYLYHSVPVRHVGGIELTATLCDDFSQANNQNIVFEGRFPRYDNEIATAAKYAKEQNLKIGDEITISAGGRKAAYIISGFTQVSNSLGKDCLLTRTGYERLDSLQNTSYYLNITDDDQIDSLNEEMKERFGNEINTTINIKSTVDAGGSVYISLTKIIVISVLILSAVVIAFVLYLLVRTTLNNKKRDHGIMKALGFTTRQLILQTALSFMPAVLLSTITGLIINSLIINPLTAFFLSGIGIVKCTFTVPAGFIAMAGAGLVLLAFSTVCLLSLKIRKIAPRKLLAGE